MRRHGCLGCDICTWSTPGPWWRSTRQPNQWGCPGSTTVDLPPVDGVELWVLRLEWLERESRVEGPIMCVGVNGELPPTPGIIVKERLEVSCPRVRRELLFGIMM
jgi:hypothetical protein